jgi:hypothetical protein
MIKIAALMIAFGGQMMHFAHEVSADFRGVKLCFEKLLKADCDTPDPGDPDSFE